MKKFVIAVAVFLQLILPVVSRASNLIVIVKDVVTELPIKKAAVSLVRFDEKEESWKQDWWGSYTQPNGITLFLDLEMWQRLIVRVEAKGYYHTFYGIPFYFYGVPEIITIKQPNTKIEVFLQPDSAPRKQEGIATVKK